MRGQQVIVRSYGGKPLIRKIWEVKEGAILIMEEAQFQLFVKNDLRAIGPIGFPREDVFKFDSKFANLTSDSNFDWTKLERFAD
jgi:hypothetical protein